MKYLIIAAIAVVVIIWFAVRTVSTAVFRAMMLGDPRRDTFEKDWYAKAEQGGLAELAEEIREAKDWRASLASDELTITSDDDLKLCGRLYTQEGAERTVLLSHGCHTTAEHDFAIAAKFLYNDTKSNLLFIDHRVHGDSEGYYTTHGLKESRDIILWMELLKERFGEDHKVVIYGMSSGASAAILAASKPEMPVNLAGIIADSTSASFKDQVKNMIHSALKMPTSIVLKAFVKLCKKSGMDIDELELEKSVAKITVPVLFICSSDDTFIPCSHTQRLYNACGAEKKLVMVDLASHGLAWPVHQEKCEAAAAEFIRSL